MCSAGKTVNVLAITTHGSLHYIFRVHRITSRGVYCVTYVVLSLKTTNSVGYPDISVMEFRLRKHLQTQVPRAQDCPPNPLPIGVCGAEANALEAVFSSAAEDSSDSPIHSVIKSRLAKMTFLRRHSWDLTFRSSQNLSYPNPCRSTGSISQAESTPAHLSMGV